MWRSGRYARRWQHTWIVLSASWAGVISGQDALEIRRGTAVLPAGDDSPRSVTFAPATGSFLPESGRTMPKRIFFPPDLPPLDARINFDTARQRSSTVPDELARYVGEPFYAPLSTCLTDLSDAARQKFRPRLDEYRKKRDMLLDDLRELIARLDGVPAEERFAGFTALARQQAPELANLEATADQLRADLAAKASWYSLREWKLGRGRLKDRQPEYLVLEFELVRAAAFYQEGLRPAQRRLLREAAMMMQDALFAVEDMSGARLPPPPPLVFFSPDLARVLSADQFPAPVAALLAEYAEEKDALRRELVTAIIEQDRVLFASSRREHLEELSRSQSPRLDALEARAEALREAYAPDYDRRREAAPRRLPPGLEAKITDYERGKRRLQKGYIAWERRLRARLRTELVTVAPADVPDHVREAYRQDTVNYLNANREEVVRLEGLLEEIHPQLIALDAPEALEVMSGPADGFLVEFMRHYREDWAYYEYRIAVFEPGLSSAQRRLLAAGALERLNLPLPDADRQPSALPFMLLKGPGE